MFIEKILIESPLSARCWRFKTKLHSCYKRDILGFLEGSILLCVIRAVRVVCGNCYGEKRFQQIYIGKINNMCWMKEHITYRL